MNVTTTKIELPDFGRPSSRPVLDRNFYEARFARFLDAMRQGGYAAAVVYADREHAANIRYLTGFDPRFEEAALVVLADGTRSLILGNECLPAAGICPLPCEAILYQEFSLPGQDRAKASDLGAVLEAAGLRQGMRTALLGWKPLRDGKIEIPHYLVEAIGKLVRAEAANANDILMHPEHGLRVRVEPELAADFEFAACAATDSVLRAVRSLCPGIREYEAAAQFDSRGLEQAHHPIARFGKTVPYALLSPTGQRLEAGDYVVLTFGVWGSNCCRAGMAVASDPSGDERGRRYLAVVAAYLASMRAWYGALSAGCGAGDVFAAADAARDPKIFAFSLNPGHYVHYEEWLHSPFEHASTLRVPSMAALQSDIIPAAGDVSVNMEDTLLLANAEDRHILRERFPDMIARCVERGEFMRKALGYRLSDDVLPLGNLPGVYFPHMLDPGSVCVFR